MKRSAILKNLLCSVSVLILGISVCGCSESTAAISYAGVTINMDQSENAIKNLVTYEVKNHEIQTQNILYSQDNADLQLLTNLYDGLLTNDANGDLVPCLAESWESNDDMTEWTFHLRQDACWVNVKGRKMADITSADFVTGLEWILNIAKNESSNTSMPTAYITGAQDYVDYTTSLTNEEAREVPVEKFLDMVGIETPDDYTVVYHCTASCPYFDTLAVCPCLYPAPQALIDSIGIDGFFTNSYYNAWFSGPYIMTEFISGNEKILDANPLWWGNDENTRFKSVTIKIVDDLNAAYQLYNTHEIDNVDLSEAELKTITSDPDHVYAGKISEKNPTMFSYVIRFCYDKKLADGTSDDNWNAAAANENFRLAWYYGLDLTDFYKSVNQIDPYALENNAITMKGLAKTSDGTDYTQLVKDHLGIGDYTGESMVRLDSQKGQDYKKKAMEELKAKGVTFPVEIDYYVSSANQVAIDQAILLQNCFRKSLGDDFVKLNVKTYVSSLSKEVRDPHLASIYIIGWGADYGDPQNYLDQEVFGGANAYNSNFFTDINAFADMDNAKAKEPYSQDLIDEYKQFTELVKKASAITDDMDERYKALAEAEAYNIEHCLSGIPCYYDIKWELTNIDADSYAYCPYGIQTTRYVNLKTNKNGFIRSNEEGEKG